MWKKDILLKWNSNRIAGHCESATKCRHCTNNNANKTKYSKQT